MMGGNETLSEETTIKVEAKISKKLDEIKRETLAKSKNQAIDILIRLYEYIKENLHELPENVQYIIKIITGW